MRHQRGRMPYQRGFIRYRRGRMPYRTPFIEHERGRMPYRTPFIEHATPLIRHETPRMPYRRGLIAYQRGPTTHDMGPTTRQRGPLTRDTARYRPRSIRRERDLRATGFDVKAERGRAGARDQGKRASPRTTQSLESKLDRADLQLGVAASLTVVIVIDVQVRIAVFPRGAAARPDVSAGTGEELLRGALHHVRTSLVRVRAGDVRRAADHRPVGAADALAARIERDEEIVVAVVRDDRRGLDGAAVSRGERVEGRVVGRRLSRRRVELAQLDA